MKNEISLVSITKYIEDKITELKKQYYEQSEIVSLFCYLRLRLNQLLIESKDPYFDLYEEVNQLKNRLKEDTKFFNKQSSIEQIKELELFINFFEN